MSDHIPFLRPLRSPADLEALKAAAAADDHDVVLPTHIAERGGKIVGYAGIVPGVALINAWVDSRQVHARDSLYLINMVENLALASGAQRLVMPCAEQSPFYQLMPRLGYRNLGVSSINLKG